MSYLGKQEQFIELQKPADLGVKACEMYALTNTLTRPLFWLKVNQELLQKRKKKERLLSSLSNKTADIT